MGTRYAPVIRMLPWVIGLVLPLASPAETRGHFLFIYITPHAEGGRTAEVYFSEIAQAGDPTFIHKIAHTQLWAQHPPGEFQALTVRQGADRLRAYLPSTGSVAVIGTCEYGVIARPNQVPFLLRHYPKALAGSPEQLNRMQARAEAPLEIIARVEEKEIALSALRHGRAVSGARFTTVDKELNNEELSAASDGWARWRPPAPGTYSIYTRHVTEAAGEVGGKRYEQIREFATLAFTWPLERHGPDAEAVALFQEAVAARARWYDFPGFSADIAGSIDGRPFDGTVTIDLHGAVTVQTQETLVQPWVTEQLESIVMHRGAGAAQPAASPSQPVLRFADDLSDHPLGRLLVFEGGQFASSYRIKDRQIRVVNRQIGKQHMTITVLDNETNPDGYLLPRSYVVQYWDAATGGLRRTEAVQERWLRLGSWDLPSTHTVTTASEGGLSVRSFTLSGHVLTGRQ